MQQSRNLSLCTKRGGENAEGTVAGSEHGLWTPDTRRVATRGKPIAIDSPLRRERDRIARRVFRRATPRAAVPRHCETATPRSCVSDGYVPGEGGGERLTASGELGGGEVDNALSAVAGMGALERERLRCPDFAHTSSARKGNTGASESKSVSRHACSTLCAARREGDAGSAQYNRSLLQSK